MNKQAKRRGSMPRRKVARRKLFDDYSTDDESMVCSTFSGTIVPAKKKPLRRRLATTAGSRLARGPEAQEARTHGLVRHAGYEDDVPVLDLPAAEAPMTGRQKRRKAWMHAKLKAKEVHVGGNSEEEEVETEDGLDLAAGLAKHREAKPNPKYLGPEWVR